MAVNFEETKRFKCWAETQQRKAEKEKEKRSKVYTEKQVDNAFVKCVNKLEGAMIIKNHPLTSAGIPDRAVLFEGRVTFVEMKTTGEKCTPLQIEFHKRLKECGINTFVLDTRIDNFYDLYVYGYTTYWSNHAHKNPHGCEPCYKPTEETIYESRF